jgi:uncharacterized membrane protein YcaP (DUF421 family)
VSWPAIWHDLTQLGVPVSDKVIRTVVVYGGLILLLRLAGKRLLSQLNTLDLVVVLLLSNVVQNAIIGPDNSLLGGMIGAVVLIGVNAIWERVASSSRFSSRLIEGHASVLVRNGVADKSMITKVGLRMPEVMAALHRQGADRLQDVEIASLEPGGAIRVELTEDARSASFGELRIAVAELRAHMDERLSALEATLSGAGAGGGGTAVRAAPSPPPPPPA